jgi:hypothetical protein
MRRPRIRHRNVETQVDILAQKQLAPRRDRPVSLVAIVDNLALVLLDELGIRENLTPITYPTLADPPSNIERDLPSVGVAVVSEPL